MKTIFKGLGIGATAGYIMHALSRVVYNSLRSNQSMQKLQLPGNEKAFRFNKNTAFFSVMVGGALGSFVLATTTGKNEVHQMRIFNIGRIDDTTPLHKANENHHNEECDAKSRRSRRLSRRKTMSKRMSERQGLSDSHGGTWVTEETESEQRSRRSRRQVAMAKRFDEE